jgi:HlyD family secretion protein
VTVEARPITGALAASGDMIAREEAAVLPEVNGYRVARVLADVGDYVRAGQTLVQLDPTLIASQVAQAEAIAAQAEANALQAEDQANRVRDLDGQGVLSQEQIEQRRLQARAARAQARAQAANFRDLKTRSAKLAVTAPVSGLILERNVRPGDLSAGGANPWFRMARDGQVELAADLSEDDLARVRPGQSATVTLPSGANVQGQVRLISPQINPQTRLGRVRVLLPVRQDVRVGGFARAVFTDASSVVLTVPETAIRYDADGASLMVLGANNRVKRVLIQAGQRGSGLVQITGRMNTEKLAKALGWMTPEVLAESLRTDAHTALRASIAWWEGNVPDGIMGDVLRVTRRVNGGTHGLDDRRRLTEVADAALDRGGVA